jgi:hypothetical protein
MNDLSHPDGMKRGVSNCGVVALAVATGLPYQEVHSWFAARKRGNWKGSTRAKDRARFLEEKRIEFEAIGDEPEHQGTLQSFAAWARYHAPGRTFIVTTTGHVQVVRDGQVLDQNYVGPAPGYPLRRKRIRNLERYGEDQSLVVLEILDQGNLNQAKQLPLFQEAA